MAAYFKNEEERDAFLAEPRLAILMSNRKSGTPIGVPVWFEWDGTVVQIFAGKGTSKLQRIQNDPRVSVLVTNSLGEQEVWVAFDGTATVHDDGTAELVARLGPKYWDLSKPELKATLDQWIQGAEHMVRISVEPDRIRAGA
ncbi:MAG: pyridoxamine 5'-phosphate oxidase family protein [Pseudomonadales bacterium]|nr:pyridoxamine 5'-phosphate oxidase family protein [Pseudomonadales bacterium]